MKRFPCILTAGVLVAMSLLPLGCKKNDDITTKTSTKSAQPGFTPPPPVAMPPKPADANTGVPGVGGMATPPAQPPAQTPTGN